MVATFEYDLASIPKLTDWKAFAERVPHDIFDYLRVHAPVFGQPKPDGGHFWSLTRAEDIRTVGMDYVTFTHKVGPNLPYRQHAHERQGEDNIMHVNPPRHTRLRSFAAKAFSPKVVAQFDGWIREICVDIVETAKRERQFDAIPLIAAKLPAEVIATVMGVPAKDRHLIVQWAQGTFGFVESLGTGDKFVKAISEILKYSRNLRTVKTKAPADDMTTELITASFEGAPITDGEYDQMVLSLTLAGFETTHTLIAHTLRLMSEQPAIRDAMEKGGSEGIARGIEEMLRYACPVRHMLRYVAKDTEIRGQQIKEGDIVILWFPAANRDPAVFENPHLFMPNRFPNPHMSFGGGGPHFCVGNHLARLEVKILLEEMFRSDLRLDMVGPTVRAPGLIADAIQSLPMRVVD